MLNVRRLHCSKVFFLLLLNLKPLKKRTIWFLNILLHSFLLKLVNLAYVELFENIIINPGKAGKFA